MSTDDKAQLATPPWEQLVASAPVGLFHTDALGRCLYVNEAWCAIAGIEPEQARGEGWTSALHPADRAHVDRAWQRAASEGAPFELEYRFRRSDGTVTWVLGRAVAIHDATGALTGYVGSITDIDGRKQIEELAQERENRFRDVADQAPVMIGATDADGHITFLNKTWLDFRGKTLEEEEGWAWAAGLHPDDRERICTEMAECIAQNQPYSLEYRIQDAHGRYHWLYDTAIPRLDGEGRRLGYIGTAIVIDGQKQLEERLRAELGEKEMLLREIHHRVKNNLQIIGSLIYFQAKKYGSPETTRALDELRQRLLAMSLIHEKLYQTTHFAAVDFGDYVESLVRALQSSIVDRDRVQLDVKVEPIELPLREALPAGMILCELLTNAGKYAYPAGASGRCRISVRKDGARAIIRVQDDGVGFPEGFDPRAAGYFGWELIRALTSQLGGDFEVGNAGGARVELWFASAPPEGPGSPLQREPVAQLPADHEAMTKPRVKVFLVEDEAVVALQIKTWLRDFGFAVCGHCTRGDTALRQIPALKPDLILMDIHLADGISGIDVAEKLGTQVEAPIIYLTAYSDSDMVARATTGRRACYVTKPFQPERLLACISELLRA